MLTIKKELTRIGLTSLLVAVCAALLGSCAGQREVVSQQDAQVQLSIPGQPLLAANLPSLPTGKTTSEPTAHAVPGSTYFAKSTNASPVDTSLVLSSAAGETSWGIWELVLGSNVPERVEVQLSTPAGDYAWIALSDYGTNTWAMHGPLSATTVFNLDRNSNFSAANNCYVAVLTSNGKSATVDSLVLTYYVSGWQVVTVDSEGDAGYYISLAEVDGNPAISYSIYDEDDNGKLKYARSTTSLGASAADWSHFVLVDTDGDTGYSTSLAVVDGQPAISYEDNTNKRLKYARSTTSTGADVADWSQIVVVDDDGDVGDDCSLAIVDGSPAISYYESIDVNNGHLKYARSTSSTGELASDWSQIVTVDADGRVGWSTSLAVVDGSPAIAYYDLTNNHPKYARSTSSTGADQADWSQIVVVDSDVNGGNYTSLAVVAGNPAISYYDRQADDLKYARSTTTTGADAADWSQKVTVFDTGDVGRPTSLAVIDGNPAIAFGDRDLEGLRYIRSLTATGEDAAAWPGPATVIDSGPSLAHDISLAEIDGRPAIAYSDGGNSDLKYAVLVE